MWRPSIDAFVSGSICFVFWSCVLVQDTTLFSDSLFRRDLGPKSFGKPPKSELRFPLEAAWRPRLDGSPSAHASWGFASFAMLSMMDTRELADLDFGSDDAA